MTEPKKIVMTDPARELAEICEVLHQVRGAQVLGEEHLAREFNVDLWSQEFCQILFALIQRVEDVTILVSELSLDEDYKNEMREHITDIGGAFNGTRMRLPWISDGNHRVSPKNVQPLKAVSGLVRLNIQYPRLDDDDVNTLTSEVSDLIAWLKEHQLVENDFIRQALLDGLKQFQFRLFALRWVGRDYALESMRSVIAAYVMLERTGVDPQSNPDAHAVLNHVMAVVRSAYGKMAEAKSVFETGDFLLKAYGATELWMKAQPKIVALLQ